MNMLTRSTDALLIAGLADAIDTDTPTAWTDFAAAAEALLRAIAPDLVGCNIYIVSGRTTWRGSKHCDGWTHPCGDLLLRAQIGAGWMGRGVTFVVNDEKSAFVHDWVGVAVHELAHWAEYPIIEDVELPDDAEVWLGQARDRIQARQARELVDANFSAVEWAEFVRHQLQSHGPAFVRTAGHLYFRARRLGIEIDPGAVLCRYPGRAAAKDYFAALADEAHQLRDLPIAEVLQADFPRAFAELIAEDLARDQVTLAELGKRKEPTMHPQPNRVADVLAGLDARRREQAARYPALVVAIADGHELDLGDVEAALAAAKKTPADLASEVALVLRQREHHRHYAAAQGFRRQMDTVQQAIDQRAAAHRRRQAELQAEHDADIGPLHAELERLRGFYNRESADAERLYVPPRVNAEAQARVRALQASIEVGHGKRDGIGKEIVAAEGYLRRHRAEPGPDSAIAIVNLEDRLVALRDRQANVEDEIAGLLRARDEAAEQVLQEVA
jgi:hypothetical protein